MSRATRPTAGKTSAAATKARTKAAAKAAAPARQRSPFFDDVSQLDLELDGHRVPLPIFYYDGSAMTAAFPARLSALRRHLPDRRFNPARLAPGIGVVAITCFEYVDTDIGSYNELAIAIPLSVPDDRLNPPLRALLGSQITGQTHAYVHHLPVTTEIARVAGKRLWNYPKFVADIDFADDGGQRVCRLAEGDEHILTVTRGPIATRRPVDTQVFSHLWHERQPQRSEFKLHAGAGGQTARPGAARVDLGNRHPIALELRETLLSTRSIAAQWSDRMEGILFGPEHLTLPLLSALMPGGAATAVANGKG